jgi:hypothetical protein
LMLAVSWALSKGFCEHGVQISQVQCSLAAVRKSVKAVYQPQ